MDRYEFFPAAQSLRKLMIGGAIVLAGGMFLFKVVSGNAPEAGAYFLPVVFLALGAWMLINGLLASLRPRPCFIADATGFKVMKRKRHSWDDLVDIKIRRIRVGLFPAGTWVTLLVRRNGRGLARREEIPWSHLPGDADETAAAILQAATLAGWQPKGKRATRNAEKMKGAFAMR